MKRYKLFLFLVGVSFLLMGSAYAMPTLPGGPFTIKIENFEYFNPELRPSIDGSGLGIGDQNEDNWGIAYVSSIASGFGPTTQTWSSSTDNYELFMVFGGLDVTKWQLTNITGLSLFETGAATDITPFFKLYMVDQNAAGFQDWLTVAAQGTSGRIGDTGYDGISDVVGGVLVAGGTFVNGITANPNVLTSGKVTNDTFPPIGDGFGYLDVTEGTWEPFIKDYWNTPQGLRDMKFHFNFEPSTTSDWALFSNDPLQGYLVPEPGTIFLLGLGLIGLAGFSRRKSMR